MGLVEVDTLCSAPRMYRNQVIINVKTNSYGSSSLRAVATFRKGVRAVQMVGRASTYPPESRKFYHVFLHMYFFSQKFTPTVSDEWETPFIRDSSIIRLKGSAFVWSGLWYLVLLCNKNKLKKISSGLWILSFWLVISVLQSGSKVVKVNGKSLFGWHLETTGKAFFNLKYSLRVVTLKFE